MRRIAVLTALVACLALSSGCKGGPSQAYIDMTTSAQMGDREGFLAGFTSRSKDLVEALISLSEAYGMRDANPYQLLVYDSIDSETIDPAGDKAVLVVRRRGTTRKVLMVLEDDAWRIDTEKLEEFWDSPEGRR